MARGIIGMGVPIIIILGVLALIVVGGYLFTGSWGAGFVGIAVMVAFLAMAYAWYDPSTQ